MKKSAMGAFALVLALLVCSIPASATVYVKPGGDNVNDGSSWDLAKKTVQAGIDAAPAGSEVWVAAGEYAERINLKAGVALYGGYAGVDTPRDPAVYVTILDGGAAGTVVTSPAGADTATKIDGFTIRNGKAANGGGISCSGSSPTISGNRIMGNAATLNGGGIYCANSSSPSVTGNVIMANSASSNGGGIYCGGTSAPAVSGNLIAGNTAPNGGAIACYSSNPALLANMVFGNAASSDGGGIYCYGASPGVSENRIAGNGATRGAGIYCAWYSTPKIANNALSANTAATSGGGIYCDRSSAIILNNTIADNGAGTNGGGVYFTNSSSPTIANNIVAANSSGIFGSGGTPTLLANDVWNTPGYDYSGVTPGTTDIRVDPLLASTAYGNLHIQADSPCRDKGAADPPTLPAIDIDGQNRVQDAAVDIGADESDGTTWSVTAATVRVKPDGSDANDGSTWALAKKTVQAAINAAAASGGEVWVAAGPYSERIILLPYASLFGGFDGTETGKPGRRLGAGGTALDGSQAGSVVTIRTGRASAAIDAFTITNGSGTLIGANLCGGGVFCEFSSPVISNSVLKSNSAANGAGIYLSNSRASVLGNTVANNTLGAGIYIINSSSPTIANNIVAFNVSGIYRSGGTPVLRNNDVYNPGGANYSGIAPGTGDISADPLFATGEVHLAAGSPCIDAGSGTDVPADSVDMDGQARVRGDRVDIGADEYASAVATPVFSPDGGVFASAQDVTITCATA